MQLCAVAPFAGAWIEIYLDTVLELEIFEVSPCTFPAYPQTEIAARKKDFECLKRANSEALNERKMKIKEKYNL